MATLEKIRSKSVLLVVIIAVALLAFILGDAITNGRNLFGNNTTVAKVGKDKIEIQDYQRKQQELSQQLEEMRRTNPQQAAQIDNQMLSGYAVGMLVDEKLHDGAVELLGIEASPELLRYFMIENPQLMQQELMQLITSMNQAGIPVQSPSDAYTVIFQPQSVGLSPRNVAPFQQQWVALEVLCAQRIRHDIYNRLAQNTVKANKLDIKAMKDDYVAAANLKVAKKPYGELTDKDYKVSDAEIQKAYEAEKEKYAIDETTKKISFISVSVPPSGKDIETSNALAATVMKELRTNGEVSKQTRKNGLDIQRHEMRLSDVKLPALKTFLQNAAPGTDSVISRNQGFLIAKMIGRSTSTDTLTLNLIQVIGTGKNLMTEVLAYANSGESIDSITSKFSPDSVAFQKDQTMPLYSENGITLKNLGMQEDVYEALLNNNGQYMVIDEQQRLIGTVTKKSSPKEIVEYQTIQYELHPSETTLADARQKLQKFISQNNTASKFVKNAKAAGYNPVDLDITPSTPAIPMLGRGLYADSRPLVRWIVMDGQDGDVSKIYQSKDPANPTLYVAAVLNTYQEYVPWNDKAVKEELAAKIRKDKVGDAMVKKYSKNTLEESAQAMGVEPVTVEKLQSSRPDMNVTDNKVKGRIMGSKNKTNKLQVVKGNDGVYAFIITEFVNETPSGMNDETFANMFVQQNQLNISNALRGKKKIENNAYKFEAGE